MIDQKKKVYICNECKRIVTTYQTNQPYCYECGSKNLDEKPQYVTKQ